MSLSRRAAPLVLAPALLLAAGALDAPLFDPVPEARAQLQGNVPGSTLGNRSDADLWRAIRQGAPGSVTIQDGRATVLIQSPGEDWRQFRNGPLAAWSAWALLAIVVLLAAFYLVRGRIRVESGMSGRRVTRFNAVERASHWIAAASFILLALTGLNLMYGRDLLLPVLGAEAFAAVTLWGKYAHNYVAFAFMASLVLLFALWIKENVPNRHDVAWILKGGGLFRKGAHPPARKFNAGQKIVFWIVILGGLSVSASGLALIFPFEIPMFAKTFAALNLLGFDLPTELTAIEEMQLSQIWHTMVAIGLIVMIIAHVYIGTLGMVGSFDAMGTGEVDENWAREHHPVWVAEMEAEKREIPAAGGVAQEH